MRLPTIVIRSDVLESWLTVSDYSKSRLAEELGVSKGRISQLLTSHEEPSAHLIAKLMTLTYLPFDRLFMIVHDNLPQNIPQNVPQNVPQPKRAVQAPPWGNRRNRGNSNRNRGSLPALKGDK